MPWIESARIVSRKHDESCGRRVPAWKSVGLACTKCFDDMSR